MAGTAPGQRIVAVDLARAAALCGMAVYHFTYDLELFGLIPPGTAVTGGWAVFARVVAGSFLFLAGLSLHLGHGSGLRPGPFLRRLAVVAGAALAITVATRVAMPERYIFFGILHSIAAGSVLGLAFLRLPAALTLAAAAGVVAVAWTVEGGVFDLPALAFLGLSTTPPRTMDFVPLFPWAAPLLAGIAASRLASGAGIWTRLAGWRGGAAARALGWPGRHSLLVYLLHQPVLIALIWAGTRLAN
jgi:uncharacterized membrane protein